jgi:hypothetical protein
MTQLKAVLQQAVDESDKGGGALSVNTAARLEAYRRRQFVIFLALEFLVVVGVGYCAWYLVSHQAGSNTSKALSALIGVGSGGGIEIVRRVWKEWSRTDFILLMLNEASESQVKSLVDRLLKTL